VGTGWLSNDVGWAPQVYERWFRLNPYQAELRRREEAAVEAVLAHGDERVDSALEVGSGTGHYTLLLARRCDRVHATDSTDAMLRYLRRRLERDEVGNVTVASARLPELGVDGRYDLVLSVGVLNYLGDLAASLEAMAATLRPGGAAVFTVPLQTPGGRIYWFGELLGRHRVWLRTPAAVEDAAASAGLRVVATERAGFTRSGLTLAVYAVREPAAAAA
jgi:predicted TPR repeat methyltransferase